MKSGGGQKASRYCLLLYPLTIVALVPIWMAFPSASEVHEGVNASKYWNDQIFKPLKVALVFATEMLATASDMLLLRRVLTGSKHKTDAKKIVRNNLLKQYAVVWTSVLLDVLLKLLIFAGQPVLFDSQVTNLTLSLRAAANLKYGLTIREVFAASSKPSTAGVQTSGRQISSNPGKSRGRQQSAVPGVSRSIDVFPPDMESPKSSGDQLGPVVEETTR
ncbi:hypothetical protein HKX48_008892 [Thoreauomyces humboldtii]|nr:hypothetical protein HKX48_008892 [Thoreauomyces humboldtii]